MVVNHNKFLDNLQTCQLQVEIHSKMQTLIIGVTELHQAYFLT